MATLLVAMGHPGKGVSRAPLARQDAPPDELVQTRLKHEGNPFLETARLFFTGATQKANEVVYAEGGAHVQCDELWALARVDGLGRRSPPLHPT